MKNHNLPLARRSRGQSSLELTLGLIIFMALVLASVDLLSILNAGSLTDQILRQSLRLAARQNFRPSARSAFEAALMQYRRSGVFKRLRLSEFEFDQGRSGKVIATLNATVQLPIPIAGWNEVSFTMRAQEVVTAFLEKEEVLGQN